MFLERHEKTIHFFFLIGLILKGINGLLEAAGGVALLFISKANIGLLANLVTSNELAEDPHDVIANYLLKVAADFSLDARIFSSVYLLAHGLVKIFLVGALLKKKLWAYPLAMIVFILFIIYQLYRYGHTGSVLLLLLSGFDFILIILTWLEYRFLKARAGLREA